MRGSVKQCWCTMPPDASRRASSRLRRGIRKGSACMADAIDQRGLHIAEEPHLEVWSVRRSRISKPAAPAQSWAQLEPHAWLVIGARPAIESAHPFLVTELSDRFTAFRISGEKAADFLAAASSAALPS